MRSRDPCFVEGMDAYGMLLRESGDARALNVLSSDLAHLMPQSAESWTCMAMRSTPNAAVVRTPSPRRKRRCF